jgi:hypothetical protein
MEDGVMSQVLLGFEDLKISPYARNARKHALGNYNQQSDLDLDSFYFRCSKTGKREDKRRKKIR